MHIGLLLVLAALSVQAPPSRRQSPDLVAQRAWAALNEGRTTEAGRLFDEALKAAPDNPDILVGAAAVAHLSGRS